MRAKKTKQRYKGIATAWYTSPLVIAVFLYVLAILLRVGFIYQTHNLPDFRTPTPGLDTCVQWEGAKHIRMGTPDPCLELMLPSAPFHPYFIAICQTLLGENLVIHRVARALLGSLSVLLVFLMAFRLTGNRLASAAAALIVLGLPSWIYFDTMVIKASPEILLLCIALWSVLRIPDHWPTRRFLALGIFLGVLFAILRFSQGATIFYITAIAVYVMLRRGAPVAARLMLVVSMVALVLGSQMAFKYREQLFNIPATRFLPVSGVHMRIGFQEGAIGTYHVLQRFPALPLGHTFFSRMAAEALAGRQLTPAEANRSYINEAVTFIKENPGETLQIILRKIALFFNNFEPAGNHYLPDIQARASILRLPSVGYGGLVILAFWGCIALWRERRYGLLFFLTGMIVAVLIPNLLGFVTWRYRIHATVPLVLLSAPGLIFIVRVIRDLFSHRSGDRRTLTTLGALCLMTGVVAFLSFRPVLLNARKLMNLTAQRNLQTSMMAEKFNVEVRDLENMRPLSSIQGVRMSTLLHCLGRYTDAFRELQAIIIAEPQEIAASRQYIVYLMWHGNYDGVVEFLARLSREDPPTLRRILRSFESDARFWREADVNLKLIVQALMRDIVLPRLRRAVFGTEQPHPVAPRSNESGA
jgi:hypothetical protein